MLVCSLMRKLRRSLLVILALLIPLAAYADPHDEFGEKTKPAKKSERPIAPIDQLSKERLAEFQSRAPKVRALLVDYSAGYTRLLAPAVLKIREDSGADLETITKTLHWIAATNPYINSLGLRPNPYVAVLDLLSLTERMERFFKGTGSNHFGEQTPEAKKVAKVINEQAWLLAKRAFKPDEFEVIKPGVLKYATNNPVKYLALIGHTEGMAVDRFRTVSANPKTGGLLSGMQKQIADTATELEYLNLQIRQLNRQIQFIPLIAGWRAELTLYQWLQNKEVAETVEDLQGALKSLNNLDEIVQTLHPAKVEGLVGHAGTGAVGLTKLGEMSDEVNGLLRTLKFWAPIGILAFLVLFFMFNYVLVKALVNSSQNRSTQQEKDPPLKAVGS